MPETASFRPDYGASADFFPPPNFGEGAEGRRDLSFLCHSCYPCHSCHSCYPCKENKKNRKNNHKTLAGIFFNTREQEGEGSCCGDKIKTRVSFLIPATKVVESPNYLLKVVANNVVGILVPAIGSFVLLHRLGRNIDCRQFYTVATKSSPISIW